RVVVALGATHVYAEEHTRRVVGQIIEALNASLQEAGGALVFLRVPGADHNLAEDRVPRLMLGNRFPQIFEKFGVACEFLLNHFVEDAAKMQRILGAFHQPPNGPDAFVRRTFIRERLGLTYRWNTADQVERDPAKECGIVTLRRDLDLLGLPMLLHERID